MYTPNNIYTGWEDDIVSSQISVTLIYRGPDGSSSTETVIPPEKIIEDSVTIKENICLSKFHTGGAISRQLDIKLIDNTYDPTYSDIVVAQTYTLENETVVTFPMGTFVVDIESVRKRQDYIELTAYDCFVKADDIITQQEADAFAGTTLWDVFSYAAQLAGLTLGFVQSDISGYSNYRARPFWKDGNAAPYDLQKALTMGATYRDILASAAALIGCALKIDRVSNQVKLIKFAASPTSVLTIDENNAIKREINDRVTRIRYVSYGSLAGMQVTALSSEYYAADLSLGNNVLLPDEPTSNTATIVQAAVGTGTNITSIPLYECDISWFGYPGLEAGDYITSEQSWLDTETISVYVMENVWKPHAPCTIRSFGAVSSNVYASGSATSYGEARRASRVNVTTSQEAVSLQNQIDVNTTYSTAEHTVGKWLDGSNLYEKTYIFLALGDDTAREVSQALGISRLSEIVESKGQLLGSGYSMPIPTMPVDSTGQSADAEGGVYFLADTSNNLLIVKNGAVDRSGEKAYITLRYTKLPPEVVYGYRMTQASYDLITPDEELYYAIFGTASGETITAVSSLTRQQYEDISVHGAATLYIITDGSTIYDVYVGDTEAEKLYQGSTQIWERQGNIWRGSFVENTRWTTSNMIYGKTASSGFFMGSEYSFEVEPGVVYHYTATKTGPATMAVIINQYAENGSYISTVGNQPDYGLLNDDILWTTDSNAKYWTVTYRDQNSVVTLTPSMVSNVVLEKYQS